MDEDNFLHLTDAGCEVAEQVYEKHRFFTQRLIAAGVDPKTAEADACRIEHVISEESFQTTKGSCRGQSHKHSKRREPCSAAPSLCNREVNIVDEIIVIRARRPRRQFV